MNGCSPLHVNLIGMPYGEHGLGQELRDKAAAFLSVGIEISIVELNYSSLKNSSSDREFERYVVDEPVGNINIICLNLSMYRLAMRDKPEFFEDRWNILLPFWEFSSLPKHHIDALHLADEVWTPTKFLTDVFSRYARCPVRQMPLHVRVPSMAYTVPAEVRSRYSVGEHDFIFLMMFDCNSIISRKDPEAGVLAFLEAFRRDKNKDENVRLILKFKLEHTPSLNLEDLKLLENLAKLDNRIVLINEKLDRYDTLALINSCDVFLSPHRAEGLGRGIVEAMLLGKPVIATAYSGVQEYLQKEDCFRIPYDRVPVGGNAIGDVRPEYEWALPDVGVLSRQLRRAYQFPELSRAMGLSAQKRMTKCSGPAIFGEEARRVIESFSLVQNTVKELKASNRFMLGTGERQTSSLLDDIRADHLERYKWAVQQLVELDPNAGEWKGADVFCGCGYGSFLLSKLGPVWSLDGSVEAIEHAKIHYQADSISYVHGVFPCSLPNGELDYIVSFESIEHTDLYKELIFSLVSSVKKGGYILISVPNEDVLPFDSGRNKFHFKHFQSGEIIKLFEDAGADCVRICGQDVYERMQFPAFSKLLDDGYPVIQGRADKQFLLFIFKRKLSASANNAELLEPPIGDTPTVLQMSYNLTKKISRKLRRMGRFLR